MRLMRLAPTAFLALASASCVPILSVFPFFFEKDVVFDERLVGEWLPCEELVNDAEAGESERDVYGAYRLKRKGDAKAYEMIIVCRPQEHEECIEYSSAGIESSLTATLFTLGDRQYLDVGGVVMDDHTYQAGSWTMSPAHSLFRVALSYDRIDLWQLDDEKVKEAIDGGKLNLAHRPEREGGLLLTAPTKTLRKLVLKSADDLGLFQEAGGYCRVSQG